MIINRIFSHLAIVLIALCMTSCDDGSFGDSSSSNGSSSSGGANSQTDQAADAVQTSSEATPAPSSTVVVIGDSIGTGFGVATGFPVFLQQISGRNVVNNSQNGRQTATGVGLASSLIAQHNPSHLVVLLGTNDALRGSVPNAISNLQAIANIGSAAGVKVVIGTLPPIATDAAANGRAGLISRGIRGIGNARIANIRGEVNVGNLADGIHPNNDGQRIIGMTFSERL
jgi:lysophospholipase L1-like esterase